MIGQLTGAAAELLEVSIPSNRYEFGSFVNVIREFRYVFWVDSLIVSSAQHIVNYNLKCPALLCAAQVKRECFPPYVFLGN